MENQNVSLVGSLAVGTRMRQNVLCRKGMQTRLQAFRSHFGAIASQTSAPAKVPPAGRRAKAVPFLCVLVSLAPGARACLVRLLSSVIWVGCNLVWSLSVDLV